MQILASELSWVLTPLYFVPTALLAPLFWAQQTFFTLELGFKSSTSWQVYGNPTQKVAFAAFWKKVAI